LSRYGVVVIECAPTSTLFPYTTLFRSLWGDLTFVVASARPSCARWNSHLQRVAVTYSSAHHQPLHPVQQYRGQQLRARQQGVVPCAENARQVGRGLAVDGQAEGGDALQAGL